jgi:hypothetical protein
MPQQKTDMLFYYQNLIRESGELRLHTDREIIDLTLQKVTNERRSYSFESPHVWLNLMSLYSDTLLTSPSPPWYLLPPVAHPSIICLRYAKRFMRPSVSFLPADPFPCPVSCNRPSLLLAFCSQHAACLFIHKGRVPKHHNSLPHYT